ncbi:MAG TPA: NAD-dependent epimerase/dehydratase family protein, partial [Dehalococcoidia bacterium]|nr:NAD-dependent epimerase/dehydratase family protein [Dehalococcoidia bacterium]
GHQVRIIDSLEPPVHPQRVKPAYIPEEVEFIQGNVGDKEKMEKALSGVDIVFHLAAYQDYLTNFSRFALVNDVGTALLYELIINEHLPIQKVILGSSQAVYGEGKYECHTHGTQYSPPRPLHQLLKKDWEVKCFLCHQSMKPQLSDESRVNPHNQYAISKYCQELYALNLGKRYNIPTVALRYSITQGPRQSFFNAYSGILRIFSLRLLNDQPPIVYEDGQQLRDYGYVGDVARANLLAMEQEATDYQVFAVGGNKAISVLEYAKILINLVGKDIEPELLGEFRWGDVRHIISDSSKLRSLGWEASTPIEQIAKEYLNWIQDQPRVLDYYAEAAQVMRQMGVIRAAQKG